MTLGSKIRNLRKQNKLTLEELADKLNDQNPDSSFNKGRLSKWENDSDEPRISSLKQVADFFGVSIDYFFDDNSNNQKKNDSPDTIAAHIDDDTPEAERQQIINFIENLKRARNDDKF